MAEAKKPTVLVTILRRDLADLDPAEREGILAAFPDHEIEFRRTDPRDFREHFAQCEQLKPAAVILPRERPIPSLAMEHGYRHIAFIPCEGQVRELEPMNPSFKPFIPPPTA